MDAMVDESQSLARACADAMMKYDNASKSLGIEVVDISPGHATLRMRVREDMLNGHGICHGGLIFTLADSCFAYACNSRNQSTVAQGCTIEFLRPGQHHDVLTAIATETSLHGRNGIYDIEVCNQNNEAVAHFRGKSRTIRGNLIDLEQI